MQAAASSAATAASNAPDGDFVIVKGMLVEYKGKGGDVVIPEGVTRIGSKAFYRCKTLTSAVIPEGVVRIDSGTNAEDGNPYRDDYTGAFAGCVNLKKVTLPKGLKLIGGGAFYRCKRLTGIDIPNTVVDISSSVFQESGLKSIVIPDSVVHIWDEAFRDCKRLKKVTLPRKNKAEAYGVFRGCTALESIVIPGGFETIYGGMFEECTRLKRIDIEEGVKYIDIGAFERSPNIEIAVIPRSVIEIGSDAFGEAKDHKKLTIYCYTNTAAAEFAKEAGIASVSLDKVVPKATELKSAKGGKKRITVKWKMDKDAGGYELQYARKKGFSDAKTVKIMGANITSRVIRDLKSKKYYYIRIRTYKTENGETWRSDWSKAKKVKTK